MPSSCYVQGCENHYGTKPVKIILRKKGIAPLDPLIGEVEDYDGELGRSRKKVKRKLWHGLRISRGATEEIRNAWLKNIPQSPGVPYDFRKHYICNLHFNEADILKEDKFTIQGDVVIIPRAKPLLSSTAVPFKFPKSVVKRQTKFRRCTKNVKEQPSTSTCKLELQTSSQQNEEPLRLNPCLSPIANFEEEVKPFFSTETTYYCAFCMKIWTSCIASTTQLLEKVTVFKKFLKFLGTYANTTIDFNIKQFAECVATNTQLDLRKLKLSGGLTACSSCFQEMRKMCVTLEELDLLKMKTTAEILKFTQLLQKDKKMAKEQEKIFSKMLGPDTLNEIKTCHENVRKAAERLLLPRVTIKVLKPHSVKRDESTPILKEDPTYQNTTNVFSGSTQIRQLIGVVRSSQILSCHSCTKACKSRNELEDHRETYHNLNGVRVNETTSMSLSDGEDANEENNDQGSLYYPSAHGSPMTSVDLNDITYDHMDAEEKNQAFTIKDSTNQAMLPQFGKMEVNENVFNKSTNDEEEQPATEKDEPSLPSRMHDVLSMLCVNNSRFTSQDPGDKGEHFEILNDYHQVRKTMGPDPDLLSGTTPSFSEVALSTVDASESLSKCHEATLKDQILVEPKPELEPEESPRKVPFMSSEYIGKYKMVCKLKNLQTGKTVLGIVAKSSHETKNSSALPQVPKVISIEQDLSTKKEVKKKGSKKPPPPSFSGPPFLCPLEGCTVSYLLLKSCKTHYRRHMRKIKKMHDDIANGIIQKKSEKAGRNNLDKESYTAKQRNYRRMRNDEEYQCQVGKCGYGFKSQQSLDYHVKVCHTEFQCHFCSEKIFNLRKLVKHEIEHVLLSSEMNTSSIETTDILNEKRFTCPRCGFISNNSRNFGLLRHYSAVHFKLKSWRDAVIRKWTCPECNRGFNTPHKYVRHAQTFHGKTIELPFQCSECDSKFLTELSLKSHKVRLHSNKLVRRQVLKCNICSNVYTQRRYYDNHMKRHSTNEINEYGVSQTRRSPDSFDFSCDECGRRFRNGGFLWNHKMEYHNNSEGNTENGVGDKHSCSICRNTFQSRVGLQIHLKVHSARSNKMAGGNGVICDLCGKKCANIGRLRLHMRMTHDPDKEPKQGPAPAVCELCGKTYPSKWHLVYHKQRMHPVDADGNPVEKPVPLCKFCGKLYPNMGLLRKHINTKHENDDNVFLVQ